MSQITALSWNLERNGGNDAAKRRRVHEMLAKLNPHLLFRQDMWGSDADGSTILYELEAILGLRSWLGPRACTAIFADPALFQPVREWPLPEPLQTEPLPDPVQFELLTEAVRIQPTTALTMRYLPAGRGAMPMNLASYHFNYASVTGRLIEAEWLTTWADKEWQFPSGETVRLPCLAAGDSNSYPVPLGIPGDPPLPVLDEIRDEPHRLHRSYMGPQGFRLMDDRPDEALCAAGMGDVARYWATTRRNQDAAARKRAVARTMNACETHGPDSRVDRYYATRDVLTAVIGVDVIEVPESDSDHHIGRVILDGDILADVLNRRPSALESLAAS